MDLEKIVSKLRTYYNNELTEDEIYALDTNLNEGLVRRIVSRIWHEFLTDPFAFEAGKDFKFLIKNEWFYNPDAVSLSDYLVMRAPAHKLELITPENIGDRLTSEMGFIVNVDWINSKTLFLPIDFLNQSHTLGEKLNPLGVFCITLGDGMVESSKVIAGDTANDVKLPFIELNKKEYLNNYTLSSDDKNNLIINIIADYIYFHDFTFTSKLRDSLIKKYGTYILKRYHALNNDGLYNDTEFLKEIFMHIETSEKKQGSLRVG